MDKKEIFDRIEYVVACVGAFAQQYNLSNSQAYAYLRRFTGIEFLLDCYAAEHTLSIDDAVSDLQVIWQLYLSVPQIRNWDRQNCIEGSSL